METGIEKCNCELKDLGIELKDLTDARLQRNMKKRIKQREDFIRFCNQLKENKIELNPNDVWTELIKNGKATSTNLGVFNFFHKYFPEEGFQEYSFKLQDTNSREVNNARVIEKIEYISEINDIDDLIISLYVNLPPLRGDYHSVLLKDFDEANDNYYKEGKIVFNTLLKKRLAKPLVKQLDVNQTNFLDSLNQVRLFQTIAENPPLFFAKHLQNICKKKLGKTYGINDFRRLYITNFINTKIDKDLKYREEYELLENLATEMNTSQTCIFNNYIGKLNNE